MCASQGASGDPLPPQTTRACYRGKTTMCAVIDGAYGGRSWLCADGLGKQQCQAQDVKQQRSPDGLWSHGVPSNTWRSHGPADGAVTLELLERLAAAAPSRSDPSAPWRRRSRTAHGPRAPALGPARLTHG